jgi:hypothetical protein
LLSAPAGPIDGADNGLGRPQAVVEVSRIERIQTRGLVDPEEALVLIELAERHP